MPEMKTTLMEDDIKMLKLEYLSNHLSDLPQILNLSLGTNSKFNIIALHEVYFINIGFGISTTTKKTV